MEEKNGFVNAYLRGKSQETEKDKGVGGGGKDNTNVCDNCSYAGLRMPQLWLLQCIAFETAQLRNLKILLTYFLCKKEPWRKSLFSQGKTERPF